MALRPAIRGVLLGLGAAVAFLVACGSSKLAGPNGDCFVTTDCREGLVCIEQQDKSRRCTDDPSRAVGRLPPEASVPDTGEAGGGEAGDPAPPQEAGPPQPPPPDAAPTD